MYYYLIPDFKEVGQELFPSVHLYVSSPIMKYNEARIIVQNFEIGI